LKKDISRRARDGKPPKRERKGVMVGGYIPPQIKSELQSMARARHLTLTELIIRIFNDAIENDKLMMNNHLTINRVTKGDDDGN
jgi:hypothetical protein